MLRSGRDGFGLHRFLLSQGVETSVVDSASIEVNRRYRRAKTDRLDVHKLLTCCCVMRLGKRRSGVWYGFPALPMKTAASCQF